MVNRVHSFSVRPDDKEATALVEELKMISISKGVRFNYLVLEALKLYKAQIIDPSLEVADGR